MAHLAETLKEQGNAAFKAEDFEKAESLYTQAILRYSKNPLLFTNRAFARLKLCKWEDVIDDCLRSIDLLRDNMKAYFYLAQAQLAINHPNEALASALSAYQLCLADRKQVSSAPAISALVLKCKKAKWDARERERLRRSSVLLAELEEALEKKMKIELSDIHEKLETKVIGRVEADEEREVVTEETKKKIEDLRSMFAAFDPQMMAKREVPEYLVDPITFEIMHDPVITKTGQSYERTSIIEHLKRNPTDPLSRESMTVRDLRPNLALKEACTDFLEKNAGWAVEW